MNVNEETLTFLAGYISQTLSPNPEIRKPAEKYLESVEKTQNYPLLLLQLVDHANLDLSIRVAAAIAFKNFVKRNWKIEMLVKYSQNPLQEWKSKDAALYLVTSLVAKGQTQREGVTKTNDLVSVPECYQNYIIPELTSPNIDQLPVLKADAIKYVMIFRNQLPVSTVKESIPHIVRLLNSQSVVVYSYAASAIEKILLMKQTDNSPLIKSNDLGPVGQELLSNLFGILAKPASKENEYVMKAIMRSMSTLQEVVIPLMPVMLPKLLEILVAVSKNPSKPHFNHYMFESLCLCIRIMCKNNPATVTQFEATLFPVFQGILQQDVSEFIPYVFQVLAVMLDFHGSSGISEPYMFLFPCLLSPTLWEKTGNIPPLVRLLQSYLQVGPQQVADSDKLSAILGVFQKLIASKSNDHEGFNLVRSLVDCMPTEKMAEFLKPIFLLLFQRLTSSKTVKFVKCLLVYFSTYINKYGAVNFVEIIDSIEPNFMAKVLDRLLISELQKVSGGADKKICAVGVTRLICDAPQYLINGQYSVYWGPLLNALVQLFECPEDQTVPFDEHFAEIEEITSYQTTYAQLNFGGKKVEDPFKDTVPDVKIFLAQNLGKLSTGYPGKLQTLTNTITPEARNFLSKYLADAGVQLV